MALIGNRTLFWSDRRYRAASSPHYPIIRSSRSPRHTGRTRAEIAQGDKALVGNSGFRRYVKTVSAEHFAIDEARVAEDARFNGLYVLRTNTKITPLQVMLRYRDLLRVEQLLRQAKAVLATRPICFSARPGRSSCRRRAAGSASFASQCGHRLRYAGSTLAYLTSLIALSMPSCALEPRSTMPRDPG
jgi:hypothetical protein